MLQLENILNGLEQDNMRLLALLNESTEGLEIANSESGELRKQLTEAQIQLKELRAQLQTLKTELGSARSSLEEANRELKLASDSYKKSVQQHEKVESRLRTQRNVWEILCAIAVGVAVAR
jgi:septal ring factor EnvC (AmiA/AmiB activator)